MLENDEPASEERINSKKSYTSAAASALQSRSKMTHYSVDGWVLRVPPVFCLSTICQRISACGDVIVGRTWKSSVHNLHHNRF
mmetsp:Transcript_8492/g.19435  ORF Transcript_8492/g.19435 Transcript_8492/m.19435 type:complete len:83 (+) Transcript_8492:56-304(+)